MKKLGDPMEKREKESNARPVAITKLKSQIEQYKQFVNSTEERYSHIKDDDRAACRAACADADTWLYEEIEKQGNLASSVDCALTANMIEVKINSLSMTVKPIMNRAKPKEEKKVEEPKKEEEAKANGNGNEEETKAGEEKAADESMDVEDGGDGAPAAGAAGEEEKTTGPPPMDVD